MKEGDQAWLGLGFLTDSILINSKMSDRVSRNDFGAQALRG